MSSPRGRWSRIGRVALWVLVVMTTLAVVGGLTGVWAVRRSFPGYEGSLRLPGLTAAVSVLRDKYGIPQVYAKTAEDLFRAQGYVHAQDRFWEMDFRRHVTSGRLSELFGPGQVETDTFLRTLGWRRVAEREWSLVSGETQRFLTAYADGVNEWLRQQDETGTISLEYQVLGLQRSGYEIEPWHPVDSLAWLKAMAWDLRGNIESEIARAALLAHGLTQEQLADLYPPYPYQRNLPIVPDPAPTSARFRPADLSADRSEIGSNAWVVGGQHTTTGRPLLANDPHLTASMPGIWYQMGLHCECAFTVAGFTFSGVPGVVIGHNARIAWGFTNLDPDVIDLYLERVDAANTSEVDGQRRPLDIRQETIAVAGGEPVTITIRTSTHGPLLSDASAELKKLGAGNEVAIRWTALDPGRTIEALFAVNRAANWLDFRSAAALFEVPAQNMVYADVDGNIGYQSPGRVPIRGKGDGRYMAPGWDSAYDWTGFLPFADLPSVLNPPNGFVVTANQAVTGPTYPHLLTHDWSYGYRSQRIYDLIQEKLAGGGKVSPEDIGRMQFDNRNELAATIVPTVRTIPVTGPAARALELWRDWDFQQPADGPADSVDAKRSAAAAFYNAFWKHLLALTFDELPADYAPSGGDRWFQVVGNLFAQPESRWWDRVGTAPVETLRDVVTQALQAAADELTDAQGGSPEGWRWGRMHQLTLRNATFGESGLAPIEWLFNYGPAPVSGGNSIVNATGWDAREGYEVDSVPSMRMIVDLGHLDHSRWIQLTGNSGHAFHVNYHDQFDLWRAGETIPMRWDRPSIDGDTVHTLNLMP